MPLPSSAPQPLPGAKSSLALLLAINLFNYIDRYILAAAEPMIRDEFFAKDAPNAKTMMGLLAPAFLFSYMIASPIFGWMADRMRRWVIIGCGVIVWSLASGGSGLAATFTVLLVTRLLLGIGEAAYGPTAPTIIADLFPISRRGAALSWFYLALPVGSAIGYIVGGVVGENFGWRTAFYVVVPPGVILGVLCFLRSEPVRGQSDGLMRAKPTRASFKDYSTLVKTPSYVFNTLGMTAMTFAIGGLSFWMPSYLRDRADLPARMLTGAGTPDMGKISLLFGGITVVAGFLGTIIGGRASDALTRRFPSAYFSLSSIGMFVGFPLFVGVLYGPFWIAMVCMFLSIFCLFLNTGPTNTITANVTHPSVRASAYAVNIFIIHALGDAISPPVIGAIADATRSSAHPGGNMNLAFMSVGVAIVVSGVLWMLGSRHLARDTAAAPTRIAQA